MAAAETGGVGLPLAARLKDRFDVLARFSHVALAVSGGSDSTALMYLVHRWRAETGERVPEISVLTVDHGLRPASADEARAVAKAARTLGLAHRTLRWDEGKPASGLQAAAREARYGLLSRWCRENGAGCLLVGHTLDDQAETVLMRLAHGSGVEGLAGMAEWRDLDGVMLYRPLLGETRGSLRAMLDEAGIAYVDDPSNEDERFERVRVRKALASGALAGLDVRQIVRSAERLREASEAIDHYTDRLVARHGRLHLGGFAEIDGDALADAPVATRRRVLERALRVVGGNAYPPRTEVLSEICERLGRGELIDVTLGGCRLVSWKGALVIAREFGRMDRSLVMLADGMVWDGRMRVGCPENISGYIGPVGEQWPALRRRKARGGKLPAFIGQTLPALWEASGEILRVPYLDHGNAPVVKLSFVSSALDMAKVVESAGAHEP